MSNYVQELEQAKYELNTENQRGSLADAGKIAALKARIEELTKKIEEEEKAAAEEAIMSTVDDMVINGMPLREFFDIDNPEMAEKAYRIVSTAWKQSLLEAAENAKKELDDVKEEKNKALELLEEVAAEKEDIAVSLKKVMQEKYELADKLADAESKRDAAAAELEEAKKEIKRLNSQIDDLRKEIAVGAANAHKVIEINESVEDFKAAKAAAEAAKPAIYDVVPLDWKRSRYTAKLAATGEEIEFGYLEKGKYREVTAEEAEVFRAEYEAQIATESVPVEVDAGEGMELTPPVFQTEEDTETTAGDMAQGDMDGEVADQALTLEERVAALEKAVFGESKQVA
jgi:myosin heavy subunit